MATVGGPSLARILKDLLSGAALVVIAAVLAWHFYPGLRQPTAPSLQELALQQRQLLEDEAQAARTVPVSAPPTVTPSECAIDPILPAAAAESALIAACRETEKAAGPRTAPVARVLGLLGEHYVATARRDPQAREELLARARQVLTASADVYDRTLGPNASRTRHARERLELLAGDVLAAADLPAAQEPLRSAPEQVAPLEHGSLQPASLPDSPPQSVPELRQLDADLARLRAQAEAVSAHPQEFRRRAAAARAQRDRCVDSACQLAWYAERRRELLAEF